MLDVKKGDQVILAGHRGRIDKTHAASVGPKWITTGNGSRFDRRTGHGEYGAHLYTIEGYEKHKRQNEVTAALSKLGLRVEWGGMLRGHEEAVLAAVLAAIPEARAKLEGDDR